MKILRYASLLLAVPFLSASSCLSQSYVDGLEKSATPIVSDYKELLDKKSGYDANTIRIRKQAADEHMKLIQEGRK